MVPRKSGNTNRISPAKHWCFTFNNYDLRIVEEMVPKFQELCDSFVMQQERGEEGTPHIQGVISLKKKSRPLELGFDKTIHWEVARKVKQSYEYCCKEDTRDGKVWTHNYYIPRPIKIIKNLYSWQKELEDIVINTMPDDRTVYWRWEPVGNTGKSAFCKYMHVKYGALVIRGGGCRDISNMILNTDMEQCRCVIIDIPRANGNNVSFKAIECIKDGFITNTKYETGIKAFNPPHLFIFSNFEPVCDDLSMDRWDIKRIMMSYQDMVNDTFKLNV
jgi:DNA-directed RNA polymerase subunit N (RpoN/RPB10)